MVWRLHALRIREGVGAGPLRRPGIVRRCAHGKAVRMMKMHRRHRRALSFAYSNGKGAIQQSAQRNGEVSTLCREHTLSRLERDSCGRSFANPRIPYNATVVFFKGYR